MSILDRIEDWWHDWRPLMVAVLAYTAALLLCGVIAFFIGWSCGYQSAWGDYQNGDLECQIKVRYPDLVKGVK